MPNINANANSPGYGYQWWRHDRRGVDVWTGNGFGGQFLIVIPQARMVGVVNGWNVFGERRLPSAEPDQLAAARKSPERIELSTEVTNRAARRLYAAHGYVFKRGFDDLTLSLT